MLRAGGSAIDAAIAVQLVLGLVEPQSSGLGGGAFIVSFNSAKGELTTYDGRETAPAAAKPDRFLRDGLPLGFDTAVRSGLSVGVPGVVAAMEAAHKAHGKLPWAALFNPAIELAETGFSVPRRLNALLKRESASWFAPTAGAYFYDEAGRARNEGATLKNPEYAQTLRDIAAGGAAAFYKGRIADAIVSAVTNAASLPGDLTANDLASYTAKERPAVCALYKIHKICGMGPPSSGAMTIGQIMMLIAPFKAIEGPEAAMSAQALHIITEAERLAYADRNMYIADPDAVAVPAGLLDSVYIEERRKFIDARHVMVRPPGAGIPPGFTKRAFGSDATLEVPGTSHISVVDGDGNAVSMTASIESAFGSHLWAAGFLLNNQLTDFSFKPTDSAGLPTANAIAGGKRPRSSMAPTLVFDLNGRIEAVTGSPGGSQIILYVVKALVAMLDWGMSAQDAAALTNFGSTGGPLLFELDPSAIFPVVQLAGYGQLAVPEVMTSGVHTILLRGSRLEGGADPRRDGVALGD